MLKCLVFPWHTGSFEIAIVAWLSTKIYVLSFCWISKSHKTIFNHKTWFAAAVAAMNSASAVDYATISCFFVHHENILEPMLKQYLEVLFMSSTDPAQSLSENPYNLNSWHFSNLTPKSIVPLIYLSILFAAIKCISLAQCINRERRLTTNSISGLVAMRYIKHPIKLL